MEIIKGAYNAAVQKVDALQGTELQKKVKEATSNENWGTSGSLKSEIASASGDYQAFREIMDVLWKRITEKPENWRIVFKSLDLLMFLLKNGHQRIVEEVRDHQFTLRPLNNFTFVEPDTGLDRGRGVRELVKQIIDLSGDKKRLQQARDEAQKQMSKLSGMASNAISSEGSGNYGGFGNNNNNSGGGYNSNYSANQYKSRSYDDPEPYSEKPISSFNNADEDKKNKKKRKKRKSKSDDNNDHSNKSSPKHKENNDENDSDDHSSEKKNKSKKKVNKSSSSKHNQHNEEDEDEEEEEEEEQQPNEDNEDEEEI